ncbi:transglutaminase family protein [Sphingobium boeckii]|uniref:Transglutaminase-like putative cysteine protease n=1 Tax=Sphingobium boeckii TaxID=1082345 RepID=A0A7W9AIU1_9SPHN|nr:transglutaminase family protein [Sphingobium boeckii]MBB5686368.1 transglutaminase-like putative cysteine protease [Sphingobium boeckii]
MPVLTITHRTCYTYRQPVSFGEHRIMVRPRESFDQHLIDARLDISPDPEELRWVQDVFGNAVAIATFSGRASLLDIKSVVRMNHLPIAANSVEIERYARQFPFTYSPEDMPDLLRSIERQHHDSARIIDGWAQGFVSRDGRADTLALLEEMTRRIKQDFTYVPRPEKGTQTPVETIRKGRGTCRDFAVLMIEAVRALGFAARFVSGYLYNPNREEGRLGGGSTHAWVRIFLPGSGWVEFDPTNGIIGNHGLIRVAVARDPFQAVPISGSWSGFPSSSLAMTVDVDVVAHDDSEANPLAPRAVKGSSV